VTLLLRNSDIVPLVDMRDAIDILDEAYRGYAQGDVLNVPWSLFTVPLPVERHRYQMFDLRGAIKSRGVSAARIISSVQDFSDSGTRLVRMPHGGRVDQIFLFDLNTGALIGILAGTHIQLLRVGATSALGVKYLSRPDAATLGILGSSRQAERQLEALACVRELERVLVYSRSRENREGFAERMRARYRFPVEAVDSPDAVVDAADILTAATSSRTPTFDGERVRPGTHVNTLSAGQIDEATVRRAAVFTTTRSRVQEHQFFGRRRDFEGEHPYFRYWDQVQELERVMIGEIPGRSSRDQITLFYGDGAGLQFAALGHTVLERARARGVGRELPTEWFVGD